MWKTVKQLNKGDKSCTPTSISVNNKLVSSPEKICDAMSAFFYNKIIIIRQGFLKSRMDPIEIFKKLIPRCESEFKLPLITIKETQDIICKMKRSNTTGYDSISSRIIKIIPEITSVYLTDCINATIREGIFPTCLKITRILPISKPGLPVTEMSSFRPISNLHFFEKCLEEHIKRHLKFHLDSNNIIMKEHHGGIARRSTLTAKSLLDYRIGEGLDKD